MKEQVLRFSIRDDLGKRAATWRLWTPEGKLDTYLTCRELHTALKASFHPSGSWHFGYTEGSLEKYFENAEEFYKLQYVEIWDRPKPIAEGITLAFRIVTPYSSTTTLIGKEERKVIWIPNSQINKATEIDVFLLSSDVDANCWPGKESMNTRLVGSYRIPNAETICVVHWEIPMPDFALINAKHKFRFFKGKNPSDLKSPNLKAIFFADEVDGSKTLFDIAVKNNCS